VLGAHVYDRLVVVYRNNVALNSLSCMYFFEGLLQSRFEINVLIQIIFRNVSHGCLYLLNDISRGGCSGRDADPFGTGKIERKQLACVFNMVRLAVPAADIVKLDRVGTVPSTYHYHDVSIGGKPCRIRLPACGSIADRIENQYIGIVLW